MGRVTIQVIEGLERGLVYAGLVPPISIGREDDNIIRLNDERVSRFHAKLQEDGGRVILTDLDSTHGTRVTGHPVQMRVMQIGDQVSIGRCLLIYGSQEEITERFAERHAPELSRSDSGLHKTLEAPSDVWEDGDHLEEPIAFEEPMELSGDQSDGIPDHPVELFPLGPPRFPQDLRPFQRAELSDILAYVHEQIRTVLQSAAEEPNLDDDQMKIMRIGWPAWQHLLRLEMDLAVYLRKLSDPEG